MPSPISIRLYSTVFLSFRYLLLAISPLDSHSPLQKSARWPSEYSLLNPMNCASQPSSYAPTHNPSFNISTNPHGICLA